MKFKPEEDQFLKENYLTIPAKRMAKMLGRREGTARQRMKILQLVVPPEIIEKFKRDSYIKKGSTPFNKGLKQEAFMSKEAIEATKATRFQPGSTPANTKKDNCLTLRVDNKGHLYYWIRVNKGKWVMYHVYLWLKAGKQIPAGMILRFKDGDTLNVKHSNFSLVTRAEHLQLNNTDENGRRIRKNGKPKLSVKKIKQQALKVRKKVIERIVKPASVKVVQKEKAFACKFLKEEKIHIKQADLTGLVSVRLNAKTVVFVKPGTDIEKIKKHLNVA